MFTRHVFVIGDSISIQYGPYLQKMIYGQYDRKQGEELALADLDRPAGANGGDSSRVLDYMISEHNKGIKYDILLLNCGLHDMKTNPENGLKQLQVDAYRENLQGIAKLALEMAQDVLWIRTTDVVDEIHNCKNTQFHRFHADVIIYNNIADEIFDKLGIAKIDLYSFSKVFGDLAYCDHVHFTEEVRKLQGAFISGYLDAKFSADIGYHLFNTCYS